MCDGLVLYFESLYRFISHRAANNYHVSSPCDTQPRLAGACLHLRWPGSGRCRFESKNLRFSLHVYAVKLNVTVPLSPYPLCCVEI